MAGCHQEPEETEHPEARRERYTDTGNDDERKGKHVTFPPAIPVGEMGEYKAADQNTEHQTALRCGQHPFLITDCIPL